MATSFHHSDVQTPGCPLVQSRPTWTLERLLVRVVDTIPSGRSWLLGTNTGLATAFPLICHQSSS